MLKSISWNVKNSMKVLFGIVICTIITVMYLTKSFNLECFYDIGNVYRAGVMEFMTNGNNWMYDYSTENVYITEDTATWMINIKGSQKNWNFLYLELKNLKNDSDWKIYFWDENLEAIQVVEQKIQNGLNIVSIEPKKIHAVSFEISNQKGLSFALKKLQFREQKKPFGWQEFWRVFGIVVVFYCFLLFLIRQWKNRRRERRNGIAIPWMKGIQKFYGSVLEKGEKFCLKLSVSVKSKIRTVCFFLCYIDIYLLMMVKPWRLQILVQRRLVLFLGLCLLLIAFVSWEGKKKKINWKNPLAYGWFILWGLCILSEFFVPKFFRDIGIFMLLAVGPFYFSWNQMERPQDFLADLKRAMRWYYWLGFIFCIVCRPADIGYRYFGIFHNPNTFAEYLATLNLVFLDDMNETLRKKDPKGREFFKSALGLVSIVYLLQWTQSVTSFTAYVVVMFLFFWRQFLNRKQKGYGKNALKGLCTVVLSGILICTVGKWCLKNMAEILGTVVSIPGDNYELQNQRGPVSMIVQAADNRKIAVFERISQKFLSNNISTSLSGRDTIWINYIQHLNLFGHKHYLECSGVTIEAHNNLLQMMHIYGVFVLLPYVVMFYYTVKESMRNLWNGQEMSMIVAGAVMNFHVIGIAEAVTTPYSFASWLTYYLVIGSLFCISNKGEKVRR